jgi:diamine N-acetyltransferase
MKLRAIEPEDLDLLYQIENDRSLWHVGTTNVPYSRYTLHDYIATSSDDIFADRQVRLVIEDDDHQVVGMADLVHFDPQHQRAEVGIVVMKPHRRKGYAYAVCLHGIKEIEKRGLKAIWACDVENTESIQLAAKLGFVNPVEYDFIFFPQKND